MSTHVNERTKLHIEQLHRNELTINWMKYYNSIYLFLDRIADTYTFTNDGYIDMINNTNRLNALQSLINNSDSIYDWIKEYTNEIMSVLNKFFEYFDYNAYDEYNNNNELIADELASLPQQLFSITRKYYEQ